MNFDGIWSSIIYVGFVYGQVAWTQHSELWPCSCLPLLPLCLPPTCSWPTASSACALVLGAAFSFCCSVCCCCVLFPAMCFYCINFYGLLPPFVVAFPCLAAFVLLCVCPKVIKWIGFSRIISILNPVSKSAQVALLPFPTSLFIPLLALCQPVQKVASFSRIKLFCKVCWDLFGDDSVCNCCYCFCFPLYFLASSRLLLL